MANNNTAYIIFGAPHSNSDVRSISWLFGDLLRLVLELEEGIVPNNTSYGMTQPIDLLLDFSKFSPSSSVDADQSIPMLVEKKVRIEKNCSKNIIRFVNPEEFTHFHESCRQNGVTINSALTAALIKSIYGIQAEKNKLIDLGIAFSLRPYAKKEIPDQIYAFYAHMFSIQFNNPEISFWNLAHEAQNKCKAGIRSYQLASADDTKFFKDLANSVRDNYVHGRFMAGYCLTNAGKLDSAFYNCESFNVEDFCFTVLNQALFGLAVCTTTIANRLCLNFSYSEPAFSSQTITKLVDNMMYYLR